MGMVTLTAANTAKDGTGTAPILFTAGADGARVDRIRYRGLGTNIATVGRLFINNGLTPATATNNILYAEITLAATTLIETASLLTTNELPSTADTTAFPIILPPGYQLLVTLGTAVAAGWAISAIGATYTQ